MHLGDEIRQRVVAQFTMLLIPDDWDEEDALPSDASERTLLRALAFLKPSVRPALGLAGQNLLAMWTNDHVSLTLEFQAADRIRWFIRNTQGDQTDTAAGVTNAPSLPNILQGFGVGGVLNGAQ